MITKIIHEEKIQKAKKYVEKGESFVIVTHVTPDGDAIGSALGLYHFLTAYGKDNVTVVVPNDFPQFYKWMPGHKEIVIHENILICRTADPGCGCLILPRFQRTQAYRKIGSGCCGGRGA